MTVLHALYGRKTKLVNGFGNVNIRKGLIDLIKLLIEDKVVPHTQVASVLQEAVVEYLRGHGYYPTGPRFELINMNDGKVILKDYKLNDMITLKHRGRDKALFCQFDRGYECDHVKFAKEIPQIRKMTKRRKLTA